MLELTKFEKQCIFKNKIVIVKLNTIRNIRLCLTSYYCAFA